MTPVPPQKFLRDAQRSAGQAARDAGISVNELMAQLCQRRLIARVFLAEPDDWILKGGQALLVRWPYARYSKDVDLLRADTEESLDAAVTALIAAATVKTDDHPRFEYFDVAQETTADRPTTKVRFTAYFGLAEYTKVGVDVVTNLLPRSEPTTELLAAPFPIAVSWTDVPVRMWPLPDHVADKIAAMYELHGEGLLPSSRVKDLIDLVLIASETALPGPRTHAALHEEVRRRRINKMRLHLPELFTVPDETWADRYGAEARKTPGLRQEFQSLDGARDIADAFVTPLLQEKPPPGDWNPARRRWE